MIFSKTSIACFRLPEAMHIFVPGYKIHRTTQNIAVKKDFKFVTDKLFILSSTSLSLNVVQHMFSPQYNRVVRPRGRIIFYLCRVISYALPLTILLNIAFGSYYPIFENRRTSMLNFALFIQNYY